jgi:hypothetical protein
MRCEESRHRRREIFIVPKQRNQSLRWFANGGVRWIAPASLCPVAHLYVRPEASRRRRPIRFRFRPANPRVCPLKRTEKVDQHANLSTKTEQKSRQTRKCRPSCDEKVGISAVWAVFSKEKVVLSEICRDFWNEKPDKHLKTEFFGAKKRTFLLFADFFVPFWWANSRVGRLQRVDFTITSAK